MPDSLVYLIIVPGIPLAAFFGWLWWKLRKRGRSTRRPFEEMPRPAGWSLQNRANDLSDDSLANLMAAMMIGGLTWSLAVTTATSPTIILILGFVACSIMLIRSARFMIRVWNHRLGLMGEQVVGQTLDRLSSDTIRHTFRT